MTLRSLHGVVRAARISQGKLEGVKASIDKVQGRRFDFPCSSVLPYRGGRKERTPPGRLKVLVVVGGAQAHGAGRVWVYPCDCSLPADVEKAAKAIKKDVGVPDVIVNNAGGWGV